MQLSRRTFLELSGGFMICGCSGVATPTPAGNKFSAVVFSDVHFNPFDDPKLCSQLDAADAADWAAIFQGSPNQTPSATKKDTNYPLLVLALSSIKRNLGASPLILFTGDFLGHGVAQYYAAYSGNNSSSAAAAFVDKTLQFVLQQIRASVGAIPVLFAVGNCDSYTGYGPDSNFLAKTAELFYSLALNGATDHTAFLSSFTSGGYYSAEPMGSNLMVIGLNTIAFSPLVPVDGTMVDAELAWFDAKLAAAQAAGQKVWLLMHAPPGADEGSTGAPANDTGKISSAIMMWNPDYQATFMRILAKYPGVISMTLAGHTHMDEFRVMLPGQVLEITPSISPCFGNYPAYKVFTFDHNTLAPTDFSSLNYDLSAMPAQFNSYYTFSDAYSINGSLADSLARLFPTLAANNASQALYRNYYFSGNNSANPITNTNWPVYWCGIQDMTAQEIIIGANAY